LGGAVSVALTGAQVVVLSVPLAVADVPTSAPLGLYQLTFTLTVLATVFANDEAMNV
jgi:hypothetical protein